jgi:ABC-2 type transport system permease protein
MKGILAIYRREMGGYFVSAIAYSAIGLFLLISGIFFYFILNGVIEQSFMADSQGARMGGPSDIDVPTIVMRSFFGSVSTIILFFIPMLTMGIYAEERKRGTMELLITSPISEFQIVVAKFLSALSLFVLMLAPTLVFYLFMGAYSEPAQPWRVMWSGYLGLFLLGAALIAIGACISSFTESQIVAAIATFVVFLILLVLNVLIKDTGTTVGDVAQYMSILKHFEDFARGVIDTSSIIFYVSLVAFALFLTLRSLDSMRWRNA